MAFLKINPSDAVPIWKQIEDEVRKLVATGALAGSDAVPSVRDLARSLRVNPATVAKAYQRLTDAGVLTVKRGEGTFVSASVPSVSKSDRSKKLKEAASRYAGVAVTVGATSSEAAEELESAFSRLESMRKGGATA
jgi:GntR family transcriptional regulator